MEISVIVPTYNRNQQILNLLSSLERQSYQEFEVIVVNDGSTDDTLSILHNYKRDTSLRLKIIDSENRGRSGSRNLAVKHAGGDVLIFLDDDVRANKKCVELHYSFHLQYFNVILAGPYHYDVSKFKNDFFNFRKEMEQGWYPKESGFLLSKTLRINGGNFSIRKSLFNSVDGFDSRLKDKEDFILAYNLNLLHKTRVFSCNETWVYHDDFKDLIQYISRGKDSRLQEMKLTEYYPDLEESHSERFKVCNSIPKKIIFSMFTSSLALNTLKGSKIFRILPKALRHYCYDLAITANLTYLKKL